MDASEASLLLPAVSSHRDERSQIKHNKRHPAIVILPLFLYIIFVLLSYYLMEPAQTRIFERIYCREYYQNHDPSLIGSDGRDGIDEKWCKVSWVQGEVAMLKGWQLTFDSIGLLIFSIPWGYAADLYGRKPIILLVSVALLVKHSYVQFVSYLGGAISLRWTWLSALHTMFGGGLPAFTALTHTIISDVVAEGNRVTVFFQLVAVSITAEFFGSLAAAALMVRNPWIPMILAIPIKITGIVILCFLPETLNFSTKEPDAVAPNQEAAASPQSSGWWQCCRNALRHILSSISLLVSDTKLLFIIVPFMTYQIFQYEEILRLYISTRYEQTLAYATMIISIRSGCVLLVNIFILPLANRYCRRKLGARRSDLFLARTSAALLTLSFLGIGVALTQPLLVSALLVNSLGWGLYSFTRSLAISLVEKHNVARLNSFIGVFDIVGRMTGSPLISLLFAKGVQIGGTWIGLPFIFCSGVVMALLIGLMQVSV